MNGCAYDTIVTILFNAWNKNTLHYSTPWPKTNNQLMVALLTGFHIHTATTQTGHFGKCL